MSVRVALIVVAGVMLPAAGWAVAAPADNPVLTGTVGPDFSISLTDASGNTVTHLDAGTYTINVNDMGEIHDFHLSGPGVDQTTGVEFVGTVQWTVTLTDGVYQFRCDPHQTMMHGAFSVGSVTTTGTTTTTPPPPPPVAKLSGRVGPGAKIAFPAKAKAGKTRITVRDLTATDNFHLTGPGLNKKTGVKFEGTAVWTVTLRKGTYTFRSDAHATLRGKTKVS